MTTLLSLSALSQNDTLRRAIHDIRLSCAVYHIETGRFGPDMREERTIVGRKILSNLFQIGTADVVSADGTVSRILARDATRAAACVAIRDIRAGKIPQHTYRVSKRNMSGQSHDETVHFGFDADESRNETGFGDERSNIERTEMGHVSYKRIDDVAFHGHTVDADSGDLIACPCCGMAPCPFDQWGKPLPVKNDDDAE